MEDLFGVASRPPGLDGPAIGYAAQPGLAPFGTDVFNNASSGGGHWWVRRPTGRYHRSTYIGHDGSRLDRSAARREAHVRLAQ